MGKFKATRKLKEWFAERCGELLVKAFSSNISDIYNEVLEQHPGVPRKELHSAFRTTNPKSCQYAAQTYDELYERGAKKNNLNTTENHRTLGYLEIDRQVKLQRVRKAISDAIVEGPISVVDASGRISTINPKLLDIFDKDHELFKNRDEIRSDRGDGSSELDALDTATQLALPKPKPETDKE